MENTVEASLDICRVSGGFWPVVLLEEEEENHDQDIQDLDRVRKINMKRRDLNRPICSSCLAKIF
jgi:hypothetical protein